MRAGALLGASLLHPQCIIVPRACSGFSVTVVQSALRGIESSSFFFFKLFILYFGIAD